MAEGAESALQEVLHFPVGQRQAIQYTKLTSRQCGPQRFRDVTRLSVLGRPGGGQERPANLQRGDFWRNSK